MKSPTNNPLDVVAGREQEIGPFFGIVIILALLIVGALYFWRYETDLRSKNQSAATTTEIIIRRHPAATSTEQSASSTDASDLDAIKANLESETQNIDGLNF